MKKLEIDQLVSRTLGFDKDGYYYQDRNIIGNFRIVHNTWLNRLLIKLRLL